MKGDTNREYLLALEKAVRDKCMDCCGRSKALVKRCELEYCPLWPFRNSGSGSRAARKAGAGDGLEGQMRIFEEAVM